MKNSIKIFGLGLIFMSQNLLADHTTQQRSSCRILPKYSATAKIKPSNATFYTTSSDNGCSYATASINSNQLSGGVDANGNSYAYQEVHIGNDGFYVHGWANGGWSRGGLTTLIPSDLSFSPMIIPQKQAIESTTKDSYKGDGIVFDEINRTVTIKNLTGFLSISSLDLKNDFSTLQFKIFSETVINGVSIPQKNVWQAKVSLINGELLLEGDFSKDDFTNNSTKNEISYALNTTTKTIKIANNVDFNSLVVEMSGDNGNMGMGVVENFVPNMSSPEGLAIKNHILSETNFNFDVVNKSTEIEINITKNKTNTKIEEATILAFDGKAIRSIELPSNKSSQLVNVSNLSSGAYFVRYLIDGNYYLKKFII
jgi:hypothetical protein